MNRTKNPIETLTQVIADVLSRLTAPDDLEVYSMFPQTWGSTMLGFGGIGGRSVTTAYTTVVKAGTYYFVYFDTRLAYALDVTQANQKFYADLKNRTLSAIAHHEQYLR